MNFRQLDLNLLRVLGALHRTRSVTGAGKLLSLSQPATSNALARLRHVFDDELFVRTPAGLVATPLCQRIAPAVQGQLAELETLFSGEQAFDPAHGEADWRLSLSDLGEMMFLPPLAAALRAQAPKARLSNVSVPADAVGAALESREIDCAVGILQPRLRGIRTDLLFREHYVAIAAAAWRPRGRVRRDRALSLAQMGEASLVVASPLATFHGSVEQMLTRMKLADRIVLRARHFGALPDLTLQSDLLAIVPEMYARNLRQPEEFSVWQLPHAPTYEVRLVWHASTDLEPGQQWLRALIRSLFARPE